jgi:predicted nucleotidyltransferase component of viral defense system
LNVLDRRLVEDIANRFDTDAGLVEKDWHVVRAIAVLAFLSQDEAQLAFSGGTSLSKAWGVIKRFSEDIDFKVAMPPSGSGSQERRRRSAYRDKVIAALQAAEFTLSGEVEKRDSSRFFSADFRYRSEFDAAPGLRPFIRVEMTFEAPALPSVPRPIQSLIAQAQNHVPEVAAFPSVDPIETAADKLSALAWRVCTRERGAEKDDPTIVRHLHDLAALESRVGGAKDFVSLVQKAVAADANRGGGRAPVDAIERFAVMLDILEKDKLWAHEYAEFVQDVSFAKQEERISFVDALLAARRLVSTALRDDQQ